MNSPANIEVYEHALATYWFDEDGICHSEAKNVPRTLENVKDHVAFLKKAFNGKKVCLLVDATKTTPYDKETRDYMISEFKNIYKALAVVSESPFGRTIANNFMVSQIFNTDTIPMKMFPSEAEAKEWLKQYL